MPTLLSALSAHDYDTVAFLLACLRLHLVAPPSALDPSLKHRIRADDARITLRDVRHEIDIRDATSRYITGAAPVDDNALASVESDLQNEYDRYACLRYRASSIDRKHYRSHSQIVSRPDRYSFRPIYVTMQSFLSTHASQK
jgi:hypothetical protein